MPVSRLSRLAWVGCGESWVLELMGRGYVKVARVGQGASALFSMRLVSEEWLVLTREPVADFQSLLYLRMPAWLSNGGKGPRYGAPTLLAAHESFPLLLRATDAAVLNHVELSELATSLTRYASWRRKPSTESQRKYILKKLLDTNELAAGVQEIDGVWVGRPWKTRFQVDEASLTQGLASDTIARLVHGGLGFWKKQRGALVREEKREARSHEKLEKKVEKARVARAKRAAARA